MLRENIYDLLSLFVVAREKSFTRAAHQLGVSQSALSHAIRGLEERMNIRLLTRTTRSVALTQTGERLVDSIEPLMAKADELLKTMNQFSNRPAGTIRLTAVDIAAKYVLWPKLASFLKNYPDIHIEVSVDYGLVDIVTSRFDAGIRLGEHLDKDMVAVRVGPKMRMAVVATPDYFKRYKLPKKLEELANQNCINLRLPTSGGLYPWEFDVGEREVKVRVTGQIIFNTYPQILIAALGGCGLAYIPEELVLQPIAEGRLVRVLDEFCLPFPGYFLYYPSRRHHTKAFSLLIETLRYRD